SAVAVARGDHRATVHWHAPASVNGAPVTGYVVIPSLDGSQQPARSFASKNTTQVVTGLAVGRTYRFTVGARNARGVGPRSTPSRRWTRTSTPGPDAPPPAGGDFQTLPVAATLPSEATCDARVHYSPWEPRPQNTGANHRVPKHEYHIRNHPAFNTTW